MRRITLIIILLATMVAASDERIRRFPQDYWCQLFGVCEAPRRFPIDTRLYKVPRGVGVVQLAYELIQPEITRHFTTYELLTDVASHDIRIVKLWIEGDPFDGAAGWAGGPNYYYEDMDKVWRHPDIDVILVRFIHHRWAYPEENCAGWSGPIWTHEPTYQIAEKFLRRYGDQNKTIIFTNWEGDNQWRGAACFSPEENVWDAPGGYFQNACLDEFTLAECSEMLANERMNYLIRRTEERQLAIERARSEYPDANLKILHSLVLSFFNEDEGHFFMNLTKDGVPRMDPQPDLLGVSWWKINDKTLTEIMNYIRLHTGYPAYRIYIDEIGASEKDPGDQYARLKPNISEAFDVGYAFACVWMWKQTWHDYVDDGRPRNRGMFQWTTTRGKVEWGEPTSGLTAIKELNDEYQ